MHDCDLTVSPYNGHMLRNLSKRYLFICCKQSSSTHFCHFLATAFVTDVLAGSNPPCDGPEKKKGLHRWRPNNSVVGDEGCPRAADAARFRFGPTALACCAGKRFAFPQLRTLAGSNPMRWAQTKTVLLRGPFPIRWWAMRDSNPQPCACKAPALTVAPIARAERV